jgi:hypothetical protein
MYAVGMPDRSIADAYVSILELMRLARGSYKRAIDTHYTEQAILRP